MTSNILHRVFKEINTNIDMAANILNSIDTSIIKKSDLKGYNTLKIRIMINNKETSNILDFFKNTSNLMSRDYINLVEYLNNISNVSAKIYFNETVLSLVSKNIITLKSKDVDKLIQIGNKELLKSLDGYFLRTSRGGNDIDMEKAMFDMNKIKSIVDILSKDTIKNLINKIKVLDYKYVIDGGNILYSNKGKLNNKSYIALNSLLKSLKDPFILILHTRHKKKYLKYINVEYPVIFTPYKFNDDIYIILASLLNQSYIITNDNFGDHNATYTNDNNFLRNYFDELIINYKNIGGFTFSKPLFSKVRVKENILYIPSISHGFYSMDLNYK
tara:strand:- start:5029 stop:6018 length:990 start_codon:yes stop_codon:yes gene_type:complete